MEIRTDDLNEAWAHIVYGQGYGNDNPHWVPTGRGNVLTRDDTAVLKLTGKAVDDMCMPICLGNAILDNGKPVVDFDKVLDLHPRYPQKNKQALLDYVLSFFRGTKEYEKSRENVYAYGLRLQEYPTSDPEYMVDQISMMQDKMRDSPWRRDIQAITWIPEVDGKADCENPPCLQRLAVRQVSEDGGCRLTINFRSNDVKAWLFNMIGFGTLINMRVLMPNDMYMKEVFYSSESTHIYEDDWYNWARFVAPTHMLI